MPLSLKGQFSGHRWRIYLGNSGNLCDQLGDGSNSEVVESRALAVDGRIDVEEFADEDAVGRKSPEQRRNVVFENSRHFGIGQRKDLIVLVTSDLSGKR